jgi:hypothetical protein
VENLSYPTPITPKCLIFPLTSIFTCLLFAGVPDTPARTAILRVLLSKTPHTLNAEDMLAVASRAHGYAGTDLGAVVREAGTAVIKRWTSRSSTTGSATTTNVDEVSREHDHQDEQPPALTVSREAICATHVLGVGRSWDAGPVRRYWWLGCDDPEVAGVCGVAAEASRYIYPSISTRRSRVC